MKGQMFGFSCFCAHLLKPSHLPLLETMQSDKLDALISSMQDHATVESVQENSVVAIANLAREDRAWVNPVLCAPSATRRPITRARGPRSGCARPVCRQGISAAGQCASPVPSLGVPQHERFGRGQHPNVGRSCVCRMRRARIDGSSRLLSVTGQPRTQRWSRAPRCRPPSSPPRSAWKIPRVVATPSRRCWQSPGPSVRACTARWLIDSDGVISATQPTPWWSWSGRARWTRP